MLAASVHLIVRRQWLYAFLMPAYLAPALAIDLPATGRMTALLLPALILLSDRVKGWRFVALTVLFGAGQVALAWRFFAWRTPY